MRDEGVRGSKTSTNVLCNIFSNAVHACCSVLGSCFQTSSQIVPVEHPIFVREYESGTYSPAVYFICKYLATLPVVLMLQLGATSITYFMFGLAASAKRYFIFYAANVMVMLCAESIGYIISAVAGSNLSVAFALTPVGIVPLMLFGGVLLNLNSTPDYVVWLEAISFLRWGFEVAMVNEFQEEFLRKCE